MTRRSDRRTPEEPEAPNAEAPENPNPDGETPSLEAEGPAGDDASTPDGAPENPVDEGPPEPPPRPIDPRLVKMIVEFARKNGADERELDGLERHCSGLTQAEGEAMLAEFEIRAKAERAAAAKREARAKERAARVAEREAFETRKAQARKRGRVLCRAMRTCSVEGMARYEGEEFSLPKPEAVKREDRGELEMVSWPRRLR